MKWIFLFLCLPAFGQLPVLPFAPNISVVVTNALDTFETYASGTDLQGLSGGIGFAGNYNHLGTACWSNGIAGWEHRASYGISMGFNNVIGGNPSANTINAISNLYNGLVTDSLDTKMHSVICLATDDLACATATLIINAGFSSWWNNNTFVSADLTINGLIGDGSTKYLDSGVIPSTTMSLTDGGITEYIYTGNNTFACDMGVYQSGTQEIRILLGVSSTTTTCDEWSQSNGRLSFGDLNRQGYLSLNRGVLGGGVTEALYGGSSGPGHTTLASNSLANDGTLPTGTIFAFDSNGNPNFSNHRLSFLAIHHALVSADSSNFYTRIQTFRTAEGGGFR